MDLAPSDAMACTPFTPKTARFIKHDRVGKNKKFVFSRHTPGEKPGHRYERRPKARPRLFCTPFRTRIRSFVPDVCVNAQAAVEIIL